MHRTCTSFKHLFTKQYRHFKRPLTLTRHRFFLWSLIFPITFLSAFSANNANAYNYSIQPANQENSKPFFQRLNIISSFLIQTKSKNLLPVTELSDLAWDEDEQLLYAISDEGLLYHLKLGIKNKQLQAVNIVTAMQLKDKQKNPLKGKHSDAEGLSIINGNNGKRGDSQLIISFENKPRIAIHDTKGQFLKKLKTVKKLRQRKSFRGNNKALESVIIHPLHGVLTAAEKPLKARSLNTQTVYSSTGKEWNFNASNIKNSSITALEVLPDNKVLILERAYNGLFSPVVISLRELNLEKCEGSKLCKTELLAKFDSSEGWLLDNFEGLTHFRDNQYLMVSDNNNSLLQKTILVLFEILDK